MEMAASSTSQGYQCEFVEPVPEDYYCKQCCLVARKLTTTNCCGESYCNVCIHSTQQDSKPCPGCGQHGFETFQLVKYQKKILSLLVSCSKKESGCVWCGTLEELDAHLDPDTGDCEHTDMYCPLNCQQKVNKMKINDHVTNECVKRDYTCPYCAVNAPYDFMEAHWLECDYVPVVCPNNCGVTCKRTDMEGHVNTCSQRVMECEFKHVGCKDKFKRENREDHMKKKGQAHLSMMVTASVKMNKDFQKKIEEQQTSFEQALIAKEQEFERKIEAKMQEQATKLVEFKKIAERAEKLERLCGMRHTFTMYNFSTEKARDMYDNWKTPPMYTHLSGYKFCIGVDANGCVQTRGESVNVELWVMKGEYDDKLKWPVAARFTLELINHFEGGENKRVVQTITWRQPDKKFDRITGFRADGNNKKYQFIKHTELPYNHTTRTHFLKDDALHFEITDITLT
jgi:TNF receptor-associated factor 4